MSADPDAAAARPAMTHAEWSAIDAIRAGLQMEAAAEAAGLDEGTFRRTLSSAAEKLRMASSLAAPGTGDAAGGGRMQLPHMNPCPYCENFAGRYSETSGPLAVIAEDETIYVFLTAGPLGGMPGHTLVTTRRHVETIFDLTSHEAAALGRAVARTARMLRSALDPEGLLVQQHNGAAAFQTVPHIHFHVIPKVAGPFPPIEPHPIIPAEERAEHAEQLRAHW